MEFTEQILRRFVAGKKLPTAQIQHLEEGGFILADKEGTHRITLRGVKYLNEKTPQ